MKIKNLKINVYDADNMDRLLGWLWMSDLPERGLGCRRLEFAAFGRETRAGDFPLGGYDAIDEHVKVTRLSMGVETSYDELEGSRGWARKDALVTDAPLSDLMLLPVFHLPGETDKSARLRRFYS